MVASDLDVLRDFAVHEQRAAGRARGDARRASRARCARAAQRRGAAPSGSARADARWSQRYGWDAAARAHERVYADLLARAAIAV